MDPRKLFYDERLKGRCVFCGGNEETRDHVPSKVLLDEPYPDDLPVVPACLSCNNGFSLDEEYLACFLECVICGSTEPTALQRERIRRKLAESPALAALIANSRRDEPDGRMIWQPDMARVHNVVKKLAQAHIAFEEAEPRVDEPTEIYVAPLMALNDIERQAFGGQPSALAAWPELGSRAFHRALGMRVRPELSADGWVVVQQGRYRYRVADAAVQMIMSGYLACSTSWDL